LDPIEFYTGKLEDVASQIQPVHLIVVNVLAYTIINMIPYLKAQLMPDGHLITGGILKEFSREVEIALMKGGFEAVTFLKEEDWISIVVRARRR
jgi:ribosomal protein L11 methylase PrmA